MPLKIYYSRKMRRWQKIC